jgi:hypothetical protein
MSWKRWCAFRSQFQNPAAVGRHISAKELGADDAMASTFRITGYRTARTDGPGSGRREVL